MQVERVPTREALDELGSGVVIKGGYRTRPCRAWMLDPQPDLPPRVPPIRVRKTVPDCWIGIELGEGKNRQVRRMCAAVGHPVLRLVRVCVGDFELGDLANGAWRALSACDKERLLMQATRVNLRNRNV